MAGRNIDYWALGHRHTAQIISKDPYIVYPGNTQGRNSRETGEKGAFLITVSDRRVVRTEFFETGQIVWKDVDVQIGTTTTVQQLIDDIKSKCRPGSFIRVSITGTGKLDSFLRTNDEPSKDGGIRSKESFTAMVEAQTGCKCSAIEVHTSPDVDLKKRSESGDFVASVIQYGLNLESASREELIGMICETPAINKTLRSNFESMSSDELRDIVDDAIKLIVAKMGAAR
jgi:DNA repair exonuclease SbcCD nuclease subunit